jgi:predicted NUDIX family phosphoesterase
MGQFLRAAFEVLNRTRHPLTAIEIVEHAKSSGMLSTSGRTPSHTMKSKLSTDILAKGENSLFMRSGEGQFALRTWKDQIIEHIADRYQKALVDEDIVVIPATSLKRYVPATGLYKGSFDATALLEECASMQRREAEENFEVVQLVSVFIVRHGDRYLTYKRTKRLPESRLHGYYSLAFGGHLNPDDLLPLLNIFDPSVGNPLLERELHEELRLPEHASANIKYRGLLYDDSRQVSSQHLGLAYTVFVSTEQFEIGERGFLMDPKYETLDEIGRRLSAFENWSVLLFDDERRTISG